MEISNGHNQEMALIIHPPPSYPHNLQQEKKPKCQPNQVAPNSCPRCDSTNTKFCYYNNYSLSQPRYFCKACRRYWTKGGILRNVPVGGGCRKNKKSSSSSSSSSPNSSSPSFKHHKTSETSVAAIPNFPLPNDDLTLAFNPFLMDQNPKTLNPNPTFLDILRGGGVVGPAHQSSTHHGGGGFQSLCYDATIGFGGGGNDQGGVLPVTFHGGSDRTLMPPGMEVRDDDVGTGRDYWNDGGTVSSASTWHGLVNSSFL